MIYELTLLVLVAVASFNRASRPFAFALAAVWILDAGIGRYGIAIGEPRLLALVGVVDSIGAVVLAIMALDHSRWWSWSCFGFAVAALPVHVWFWTFWLQGVSYADTYSGIQNTLFPLALLVLISGRKDIADLASRVLDRLGDNRLPHGHAHGRFLRHGDSRSAQTPKGEVRPHGR